MVLTDRRGRELLQFLQDVILGRGMRVEELREACGITSAEYYGRRGHRARGDADDFPNAKELQAIATYYDLNTVGYRNLLAEFDWIERSAETPGFTSGSNVLTRINSRRGVSRRDAELDAAKRNPAL